MHSIHLSCLLLPTLQRANSFSVGLPLTAPLFISPSGIASHLPDNAKTQQSDQSNLHDDLVRTATSRKRNNDDQPPPGTADRFEDPVGDLRQLVLPGMTS